MTDPRTQRHSKGPEEVTHREELKHVAVGEPELEDLRRRLTEAERLLDEQERALQVRYAELQTERAAAEDLRRRLASRTRQLAQANQAIKKLTAWVEKLEKLEVPGLASRAPKALARLDEHVRRSRTEAVAGRFEAWRSRFRPTRLPADPTMGASEETRSQVPGSPLYGEVSARANGSDALKAPPSTVHEYVLKALDALSPPTIVIPIHNAYEDLERCLESLHRNTTAPARLLLIDDASTDTRVPSLLARFEGLPEVQVLVNETNLGYVRTVNRGLKRCGTDVVLLNSDTQVTPRWLENLQLAAYLHPRTATVTAISNNAGAFSVPAPNRANLTPALLSTDDVGRLVTQGSRQLYPRTPTGNGFCMYMNRDAIDQVGEFDAASFPRGYGEENDFCMRAQKLGWNHVVDDVTFIFHARSASFGEAKPDLLRAAQERTDRLHPEYGRLARAFVNSDALAQARTHVRRSFEDVESGAKKTRPRILSVLHHAGGGTPYTTFDLMDGLADRYSPYLLASDGVRLKLFRRVGGALETLEERSLQGKRQATEFTRPDYRSIVSELLVRYRFELVHIRHLAGHTFDLPEIARSLQIPVVLSFHDFYLSCPTITLIDDHGEHCGGICTPGIGQCRVPRPYIHELPILKHNWLSVWRAQVERMFQHVDAFVTTSEAARDVYYRSLPSLRDRSIGLIEHGRDLDQERCAVPPGEGPVKILVPGNVELHKGGGLIQRLVQLDEGRRLEFHFLGAVGDDFRHFGICHGLYERREFNRRVAEIGPSFIGILSIWPETYCHTLTEAWGAGVPVLASDIGAIRERVTAHGGGRLIDYRNPQRAYEQILEIADDPVAYQRELDRANLDGIRTIAQMAADYDRLYKDVFHRRRRFAAPDHASAVG